MLRISKLTDYATVMLACLRPRRTQRLTATEVAERTRLGAADGQQAAEELHRAGLLTSTRGTHGGYQLARPADSHQRRGDPRRARGPGRDHRVQRRPQRLRHREHLPARLNAWQRINVAIRRSLDEISLAQLSGQEAVAVWRPTLAAAVAPDRCVARGPSRL